MEGATENAQGQCEVATDVFTQAGADSKPCAASSAAPFMYILPETVLGDPYLIAKYCVLIKELGGSC